MILTLSFFKEDIWLSITDKILFSGARWDEQRAASLGDYWPSEAKSLPNSPAPEIPMFIYGEGEIRAFKETSNTIEAEIKVHTPESVVALPAVYFPGWSGGNILPATDLKLISLPLSAGTYEIKLKFGNTPVRTAGNLITLIGIFYLFFPDKFQKLWKRK
jgi:hypothetical protein